MASHNPTYLPTCLPTNQPTGYLQHRICESASLPPLLCRCVSLVRIASELVSTFVFPSFLSPSNESICTSLSLSRTQRLRASWARPWSFSSVAINKNQHNSTLCWGNARRTDTTLARREREKHQKREFQPTRFFPIRVLLSLSLSLILVFRCLAFCGCSEFLLSRPFDFGARTVGFQKGPGYDVL